MFFRHSLYLESFVIHLQLWYYSNIYITILSPIHIEVLFNYAKTNQYM